MSRRSHSVDGLRIAQARQALSMTQVELADRCHLHRVTMTRIENGHAPVSLEVLERLADALGCTREWLLGEPDTVDEMEAARDRMAAALSKIGEGFEDFTAAVDALYARAHDVGTELEKVG